MKIQAADIRVGDRIFAYFNTKMQVCTVRDILEPGLKNITLLVFTGAFYRFTASRIVRFQSNALVDLEKS